MKHPYYNREHSVDKNAGYLPHWQQGAKWMFVTWRLADALPASHLQQLNRKKQEWKQLHPEPWTEELQNEYFTNFVTKIEKVMDAGYGNCILELPEKVA